MAFLPAMTRERGLIVIERGCWMPCGSKFCLHLYKNEMVRLVGLFVRLLMCNDNCGLVRLSVRLCVYTV